MSTPLRRPQRAAHRREDILASARELFASRGLGAVTMGDIADAAGVSPGNLYYWFRHKSDVIHALFDEWREASRTPVAASDAPGDLLMLLWDREAAQQLVSSRYEFFSRDLLPLLHVDPVLRERYRANYKAVSEALKALLGSLVDAGYLRADADVDSLVRVGWMASELGAPWTRLVDPEGDPGTNYQALIALALTPEGKDYLEKRS